jgi:hypothetical protein
VEHWIIIQLIGTVISSFEDILIFHLSLVM